MLMSDYENKALAYEAYYVSRAAKGGDMPDPIELENQIRLCHELISDAYMMLCNHYSVEFGEDIESMNMLFSKAVKMYAEWQECDKENWEAINRRIKGRIGRLCNW